MLQVMTRAPRSALSRKRARLLEIIKEKSFLIGGEYKLASGTVSNYYLDMKPTMFDPEGASLTSELVYNILKSESKVDAVGGLELGAVPIIAAVCALSWRDRPMSGFVVRKEKKGHGTDKKIDGNFIPNTTVVLVDDVTTRGGSVMEAVQAVRAKGAIVDKVIAIVDRLEGAAENLEREGIELEAIFTTRDLA